MAPKVILMGIAFPLYKELPRNASTLLEGSVIKHVFHFIHWDPVFVYLDRWEWSDGVLRTSVGFDEAHMENRVYAVCLGKS